MIDSLHGFVSATDHPDQSGKIGRMKKFTLALALGVGFVLSQTGPAVRAAAIAASGTPSSTTPVVQSLPPVSLSASTFASEFTPATPISSGTFSFLNTNNAGFVESQVFSGTGSFAGLYAYAYQFGVNNVNDTSTNQPTAVNSASMLFNSTPTAAMLVPGGTPSATYVINGAVGGLNVPQAAPGYSTTIPSTITWMPGTNTGSLTFQYLNPTTNTGPLGAGSTGETIVVLTTQAPGQKQYVSVQNPEPQNGYPQVDAPSPGPIQAAAPEPATILGWAGVIGALAVARRIRRGRHTA
jgi:hypothetical protein